MTVSASASASAPGITLKKKSVLMPVTLPESSKVVAETGAAASILEKSKLGMKETSSKLSTEKAKSDKKERKEKEASLVAATAAASDASDPKEKKKSSKLGSIKLTPAALALLSSKPNSDDK